MNNGFTRIPNKLILGENLNGYEKLVLIVLITYRMENEFCFPSRELITKNTGFNIKTVDRAIKGLKEKRFLTIKRDGRKNNYYLSSVLIIKILKKPF